MQKYLQIAYQQGVRDLNPSYGNAWAEDWLSEPISINFVTLLKLFISYYNYFKNHIYNNRYYVIINNIK